MIRNPSSTQITTKAYRRSVRLQNKDYQNHKSWCIQSDPLGYFALLPTELMYHILNTLRIEDLGFLSITSKAFRDVTSNYINSKSGLKRLQPKQMVTSKKTGCKRAIYNYQVNHFKNTGLLLKRITCLFPTRERLKIVEFFVSQLQNIHRIFTCQALSCYGNLLSTFTRGWEERECLRAYITVSENQSMTSKILMLLSGNPGSNSSIETKTRRFFRHVLLDQCKTMEDLSMWLHFILKPFPMVHQARLLYLLYGPLCPGTDVVSWDCMRETSGSDREIRSRTIAPLGEIAMALKALVSHREWSDDDVISVLEELTGCPDEWLIENTARLLILCGEPIVLKVLGSKAINGKMNELGSIIVAFSVVLYDEGLHMSWLIKMVHQLCRMMKTTQDVQSFLGSITATYKDFIIALMYSPEEEVTATQFQLHHVAMAQSDFMQGMMLQLFNVSTSTLMKHS
ncbi:F-box only protein 47-like [Acanthaster planci]|uniref:F-box only protein 47-like n=1 Tax=Acanthaster planci TaxID=133434 RepID=A0A8B7ZN53_ACAPL|nr:F-box only protein 47-like [Acanthaster planci]